MPIVFQYDSTPMDLTHHHEDLFDGLGLQTIVYVTPSVLCPVIEEKGVKMKLTVIDTPGFGDQINNENW